MKLSPYYLPLILGLAFVIPSVSASAQVGVGIVINAPIAPPPLPIYAQPPMPEEGYLWTPGFWHYHEVGGYYWVPGTWVRPPRIGFLWTPPYWGFANGAYGFNAGYWGPHVGFYGGINYGFGYGGIGYGGGEWRGGAFAYNRAANNFGGNRITNVYNRRIVNNNVSRASFNGGNGGIQARPNAAEEAAVREQHVARTAEQTGHMDAARGNPAFRASENHGRPAIAATARSGEFEGHGVVKARGAIREAPGRATARSAPGHSGSRGAGAAHEGHPSHPVHPEHPAHPSAGSHAQRAAPAHAQGGEHAQGGAHAQGGGHAEGGGHAQGGNDKRH